MASKMKIVNDALLKLGKVTVITEADVEKYLVDEVKKLGGEVRKVKWRGRNGAPDTRVMLPKRVIGVTSGKLLPMREYYQAARSFWAELKRPTYRVTPRVRAQCREHARMRHFGETVYLLDCFEAVDRVLRPYD